MPHIGTNKYNLGFITTKMKQYLLKKKKKKKIRCKQRNVQYMNTCIINPDLNEDKIVKTMKNKV